MCKPYNSALGEFFNCHWDIEAGHQPPLLNRIETGGGGSSASDSSSVHSSHAKFDCGSSTATQTSARLMFLCEQVLHHPPVSAYFAQCIDKGIDISGYDQISAKFTGASVRVYPGEHNKGIFMTLKSRNNEEYSLKHPIANLTGFFSFKMHPYITVQDSAYIRCPQTKLKAIINYLDEPMLGKARFAVEGVVFRYDPENDIFDKVKAVPDGKVIGVLHGSWRGKIYYTPTKGLSPNYRNYPAKTDKEQLLIDLESLSILEKQVIPTDEQDARESRRFWEPVTKAILAKDFTIATREKHIIEQRQRDEALVRQESMSPWRSRFFQATPEEALEHDGKPRLTDEGYALLKHVRDKSTAAASG